MSEAGGPAAAGHAPTVTGRVLSAAGSAPVKVLAIGAAVCAVLSLGLRWGGAFVGYYMPGVYLPGYCTGYDTVVCTSDIWTPGYLTGASEGALGVETAARVFILLVVIAAAVALRRSSHQWAVAAVVIAGVGLLLGGLGARSGQITYIAGTILLALALHRAGLLRKIPADAARP